MIRVLPFIPETIKVHLGAPDRAADNISLPFSDYIKNVASGEIYPTWEQPALTANILAQVSFALNKIYLEYFDITSSTAYDQSYQVGRNIFENINYLVDELFDNYIRRPGFAEPLSAKFCNGTTTTCDGLSQWGSQRLAEEGKNSVEILKYYYGDDIEIVVDAAVASPGPSYPGRAIRLGDIGPEVKVIQTELNQISDIYTAIPKINPVDGYYGQLTEDAVKIFQEIFALAVDGICGKQTWYKLVLDYTAIRKLGELDSLGQKYFFISNEYPYILIVGDEGEKVRALQYYISLIAAFDPLVPETEITGYFGEETKEAVTAIQRNSSVAQTGVVDTLTWDIIYNKAMAADEFLEKNRAVFSQRAKRTFARLDPLSAPSLQYIGKELRKGDRDLK